MWKTQKNSPCYKVIHRVIHIIHSPVNNHKIKMENNKSKHNKIIYGILTSNLNRDNIYKHKKLIFSK